MVDAMEVGQERRFTSLPLNLIPVDRLLELCNPFVNPPWEEVASLSVEGIRAAARDGFIEPRSYSDGDRSRTWTVEDHIARIAYLVIHGWDDPIDVDVGVPSLGCWLDWPVTDGNHRLAAAAVRGDTYIVANMSGSCDYMKELFGELIDQ